MDGNQTTSRLKMRLQRLLHILPLEGVLRWVLQSRSQLFKMTSKPILVFSPHQDDETLACGGLIAIKRSQNIPVHVVFLTDGRYGKPDWILPEDIVQVRRQEALDAAMVLGVESDHVHFFDYADASLSDLTASARQALIERLAEMIQTLKPEEVYVPHSADNHPDHEATFKIVQAALLHAKASCDLFQYPVWLFWQPLRSQLFKKRCLSGSFRLPIATVKSHKDRAIAMYQSQLPGLSARFLRQFDSPYEIFSKQNSFPRISVACIAVAIQNLP
jgi:N-acetylglucosamine malate deacetylase 1